MREKCVGILWGLAVGDALGTTLEFQKRRPLTNLHTEMTGGGVFKLAPGQWTDDTAMAVAMGRSLIEHDGFVPHAILREWTDWYESGKHSCTGTCFDIGNATRYALEQYAANPSVLPSIPKSSLGNGPLMRLAPVVLFARTEQEAEHLSYQQALLTHGEDAAWATGLFGRMLFNVSKLNVPFDRSMVSDTIRNRKRDGVSSSGFYRDTLDAALWAVSNTSSFEDAVVTAVNLGDDADTVGAVTGQLAGAIYGRSSIPARWLDKLAWREKLEELALRLMRTCE